MPLHHKIDSKEKQEILVTLSEEKAREIGSVLLKIHPKDSLTVDLKDGRVLLFEILAKNL